MCRLALILVLLAGTALARSRPAPCGLGRFLTPDGKHLLADVAAPATEAVVIGDDGTVAITTGCAPVPAKVRPTRAGTVVRASWKSCDGAPRAVKLRALLSARGCRTLRGIVTIPGSKPRIRKLRATRAPFQYDVALDPTSPWPKFRRTARQDGASPITIPTDTGRDGWTFQTGKGIFSSPVIDGDGTIYVGSADRTFYAIRKDGTLKWSRLTGEIVDSSALLDDRGRVYFGSGDGTLYALDRETGDVVWTFDADAPSAGAFIDWFEGNVALGADGRLIVPNDNFFTYALSRDDAAVAWRFRTADQTWSLPAVDAATGRAFLGNNNLLAALGDNTFALDGATGAKLWSHGTDGTIAASPLLTRDGHVVVGGFDGFVRAYDGTTGAEVWPAPFGARDHIYASPGELPDGTIVQASADGSVYGLDPATGTVRWQFDTRDAIRSSPAIDGAGNVYVGAGDGRLYVLNPDGTLRWSIRLIDADRDDLNASPALGADAIVIAGESGQVFDLPYDFCLLPRNELDPRCRAGGAEDLPSDGAALYYTSRFGRQIDGPTFDPIDANQPLAFSLFVREHGDTVIAHIDAMHTTVTVDPPVTVRTEISGDRKFLTVVPLAPWTGPLSVTIDGQYLVRPMREGLRFSGGDVGGTFSQTFTFQVGTPNAGDLVLPLPVPSMPGDPAGVLELSRVAAPLPTILPSYNQIGFDSIHYLLGFVESTAPGTSLAWVVGAKLAEGENRTVIEPATKVLFPLEVDYRDGALTFVNESGFAIAFNAFRIPFQFFRIATRADVGSGGPTFTSPAINVSGICSGIFFYGQFLRQLGFCNPDTDVLTVFGGADLHTFEGGTQQAPAGVGTVDITGDATAVTATLTGTTLRADEHAVSLLLLDAVTGKPVAVDYGFVTTRQTDAGGLVRSVSVPLAGVTVPASVRAYLMVDTYPAYRTTLAIP